jgi:hypothetical protein
MVVRGCFKKQEGRGANSPNPIFFLSVWGGGVAVGVLDAPVDRILDNPRWWNLGPARREQIRQVRHKLLFYRVIHTFVD